MRVLVTNFSTASQTVLKAIMIKLGHSMETTADGKAALAMLQRPDRPSMAIIDSNLPGMDGFEICRRIKAEPNGADLCLILMTKENDRSEVLKALDAGADDYLQKPFDLTEVSARLRIIERKSHERGLFLKKVEELKNATPHQAGGTAAVAPVEEAAAVVATPAGPPFSETHAALNTLSSFMNLEPLLVKSLGEMGFSDLHATHPSAAESMSPELTLFSALLLPEKATWIDLMIEMDLPSAGAFFMAMTGMDEASLEDARDTAGEILNLVQGAIKTALQNEYLDVITPVIPTKLPFEKRDSILMGEFECKEYAFTIPGAFMRVKLFPHMAAITKKNLNELKLKDVVAEPVNLPGDAKLTLVNKGVMMTDHHMQKLREMTGYGSIKITFDMIVPSEMSTRLMTP